jgi:superfamily I DNA and/or RNA helicase
VIAISLVRSNRHSNIGFLADYRRLNVAMTRAKKKLFLLGDASTLREDPFFDALFIYVQQHGLVTELLPAYI